MRDLGQIGWKEGSYRRVESRECLSGVYIVEVVLTQSQDPQTESFLEWLDFTTTLVLVRESLFLFALLVLYPCCFHLDILYTPRPTMAL